MTLNQRALARAREIAAPARPFANAQRDGLALRHEHAGPAPRGDGTADGRLAPATVELVA